MHYFGNSLKMYHTYSGCLMNKKYFFHILKCQVSGSLKIMSDFGLSQDIFLCARRSGFYLTVSFQGLLCPYQSSRVSSIHLFQLQGI